MEIKRLRCLAQEIFKTKYNLNPYYMKEIFSKTANLTNRPIGLNLNRNNTIKYENSGLRSLEPAFMILCLVKSKRKQSMKNLRII